MSTASTTHDRPCESTPVISFRTPALREAGHGRPLSLTGVAGYGIQLSDQLRTASPGAVAPRRRPGSIRRTTTHDCVRPDGLDGPVHVRASGRDLHTDAHETSVALRELRLDVTVDLLGGVLTGLIAQPAEPALSGLVGASATRGFRRTLDGLLPGEGATGSLRFQLLDDVPIALMLSGRVLRVAGISMRREGVGRNLPVDICAGWVEGGTLLAGYGDVGPPLTTGPAAGAVAPPDDLQGWHGHDPLPARATRRRRQLEVWVAHGTGWIESFFRDSVSDADGVETVVHEYTARSAVDLGTRRVVSCEAVNGHLPYPECPGARASAARLVGQPLAGLRSTVLEQLRGPATCTHLNDALRSMAAADELLRLAVDGAV